MPPDYFPDANETLDLHGRSRAFFGIFHRLQKAGPYSETEPLFLALSSMMGCSAVAVLSKSDKDSFRNFGFLTKTESLGRVALIHCYGRLCFQGEAQLLAETAQELMKAGKHLVLDFGALDLLDSAGIGQLVLISMQAQAADRYVCIACASDRVRYLLELTNVASLFEFFSSVDGAIEGCNANVA